MKNGRYEVLYWATEEAVKNREFKKFLSTNDLDEAKSEAKNLCKANYCSIIYDSGKLVKERIYSVAKGEQGNPIVTIDLTS